MENKVRIYEFNPQIYPFRLWVGVKVPFEEATKFYNLLNFNEVAEFKEDTYYSHSRARCSCMPVVRKEDNRIGILCSIWDTKGMTIGDISHESLHVTDFLCGYLGIKCNSFDEGEPRAYFSGWVANCIDRVRKGRSLNENVG